LVVFLARNLVRLCFGGPGRAAPLDRFGIWLSTFGQEPPGKDKLEARQATSAKKPFAERVREHSPPGYLERRGKPVPMPLRVLWFVFVGWWLGAVWVVLSWSVFLLPYPLLDTVSALLSELPTVMTLASPAPRSIAPAAASDSDAGATGPS
jgi:hypothetical protein